MASTECKSSRTIQLSPQASVTVTCGLPPDAHTPIVDQHITRQTVDGVMVSYVWSGA